MKKIKFILCLLFISNNLVSSPKLILEKYGQDMRGAFLSLAVAEVYKNLSSNDREILEKDRSTLIQSNNELMQQNKSIKNDRDYYFKKYQEAQQENIEIKENCFKLQHENFILKQQLAKKDSNCAVM